MTSTDRVAACSSPQGLYEKALEDSEKALGLDGENIRALFRKARALSELGRHKEAYECSSRCSLARPHVSARVPTPGRALPSLLPPPVPWTGRYWYLHRALVVFPALLKIHGVYQPT